jgi:hypothetical protein
VTWVTEVGSQLHQSDYGTQAESRERGGDGDLGHGGGQLMASKRPVGSDGRCPRDCSPTPFPPDRT